MKKAILFLSTYIISIGLVGCSTTAVPSSQARFAPNDRVYKYQTPVSNGAKLTVVRDSGMVGGACYSTIFINGQEVSKLKTSEKVILTLQPGEYSVGTVLDGNGLCSFGGLRQERFFQLAANEEKVVRVFTDQSGNMDIRPTTLK